MTNQSLPLGRVEADVDNPCEVLGRGTPHTDMSERWDGDIPWITNADIHVINDIRPQKTTLQQAFARALKYPWTFLVRYENQVGLSQDATYIVDFSQFEGLIVWRRLSVV